MTAQNALDAAGGLTENAAPSWMYIIRNVDRKGTRIEAVSWTPMIARDILIVPTVRRLPD